MSSLVRITLWMSVPFNAIASVLWFTGNAAVEFLLLTSGDLVFALIWSFWLFKSDV